MSRQDFACKSITVDEIARDPKAFHARLQACKEMVLIENGIQIARLLPPIHSMNRQSEV